jgi:hypothetical protein
MSIFCIKSSYITLIANVYILLWISVITMESDPASFGDSLGNYCMFYNTPALLNDDREREFGTVIAESRNKLIIVDDEIIREHVYLISKTKVNHYGDQQMYFNIPESSLKDFEI